MAGRAPVGRRRAAQAGATTSADPTGRARPAGAPSRRRGDALDNAILGATWQLLAESGLTAVTFEAVAAAAQTSRSVVYRRWRSRDDLIDAAVFWQYSREKTPIPDCGGFRDDLIELMMTSTAAHAQLQVVLVLQLMTYLRQRGSSLEEMRSAVLGNQTLAMPTLLLRAQQRGEINLTGVPELVVNLPLELLRGRVLTSREPPSRDDCAALIDQVYFPLLRAWGALS